MGAIVVALAVVLFCAILTFSWQHGKMKNARKGQSAAHKEAGKARAEARFYAAELKKLLPLMDKKALIELRNTVVSHRAEAEGCKESPQREGTIAACRHLVDDIDDVIVKKQS